MSITTPDERKILSVLYCDIAGSYSLLYDTDPEQGKLIIDKAIAEMTMVIERFGGVVNQVQGDGVMSLFGAPVAIEDHAERACNTALALVDAFKQRNIEQYWPHGNSIEIRVGVSTGEAVVGMKPVKLPLGGDGYEYFATGAVSYLAGRLQKLAGSFEIVISAETAEALEGVAQTTGLVNRSVHELIESHDTPMTLMGLDTKTSFLSTKDSNFVGRSAELAILNQTLLKTKQELKSSSVVLSGEPGYGKSRLLQEFSQLESANSCQWYVVSAQSVEINTPFAFLRRLLLEWLFQEKCTDSEAWLVVFCQRVAADNWFFEEGLRDLLELKPRNDEWLKLEPDIRREEIYRTLRSLLRIWGAAQPTVVSLEDLHWADPISKQILESLVVQQFPEPLLFVLTSREKSRLKESDHLRLLSLNPLTAFESRQLLENISKNSAPLGSSSERLLQRSGGVPLFIEQMAFLDTELSNSHTESLAASDTSVTPIIRSLISARIDQLTPGVKSVLNTCCVAGLRFSLGSVVSVTKMEEVDLQETLEVLVDAGLIEPSTGFQEYKFVHALYQEVSYLGILRKNKLEQHELYLKYFKRLTSARPDSRFDEQVHYHAWNAQNWVDVLIFGARAARAAMDTGAYRESVHFLEQTLHACIEIVESESCESKDEVERQRAEILLELSRACIPIGEFERSYEALNACQEFCRVFSDNHLYCESFAFRTALLCVQDDADTAVACGLQAVEAAEATGSDRLIYGCSVYFCEALFFSGEFEQVIEILQHTVDSGIAERFPLDRIGNTAPASIDCYGTLGMAYAQTGRFDQAEKFGFRATEIAEQTGKSFDRGLAYFYLTYILVHRCKMKEAEIYLQKVMDVVDAGGLRFLGPWVRGILGFIYAKEGMLEKAEELVVRSIADSKTMALSIIELYALVSLVFVQMETGNYRAAAISLDEAEGKAKQGKFKSIEMWILRSKGTLAFSQGRYNEGIAYLTDAIKYGESLGMLPDIAHCHAIIARVYERGDVDLNKFMALDRSTQKISPSFDQSYFDKHRKRANDLYDSMGMLVSV